MAAPVVKFLKYEGSGSAEFVELGSGNVYTADLVTAGVYSKAAAFRAKFVSDSEFHLDSVKIWANDTLAAINGSSQDLGDGYTTVAPTTPNWWSMVFIYTATGAKEVTTSTMQTSVATCPAAVFTIGSESWAVLPADFRGNTKNDGLDLLSGARGGLDSKLSNTQYVAYTKPMGISFKPNISSQYGNYTNFSVRIDYTFS